MCLSVWQVTRRRWSPVTKRVPRPLLFAGVRPLAVWRPRLVLMVLMVMRHLVLWKRLVKVIGPKLSGLKSLI